MEREEDDDDVLRLEDVGELRDFAKDLTDFANKTRNVHLRLKSDTRTIHERLIRLYDKVRNELARKAVPITPPPTTAEEDIRRRLGKAGTFGELAEVILEDWPESLYVKTRETTDSILEDKLTRVVLMEEGNEVDLALLQSLEPQFTGLAAAQAELTAGQCATITSHRTVVIEGKDAMNTSLPPPRTLTLVKLSPITEDTTEEETLGQLNTALNKILAFVEGDVTIAVTDKVPTRTARKVLEYSAAKDGNHTAELCVKEFSAADDGAASDKVSTFLIKKQEGKSFADMLRQMKTTVDPEKEGVEVRAFPAKNGGAIVKVKEVKQGGTANLLRKIQEEANLPARMAAPHNTTTVALHDLDETVTVDEIGGAIVRLFGRTPEDLTIDRPRPNRHKGWTATVHLPKTEADLLLAAGSLRMGWTRCRVSEWVVPPTCFKCRGYGHLAHECRSEKIGDDVCYRCGGKGHRASDCTAKEPSCIVCNEKGHRASSMACPKFRACVEDIRKERASKNSAPAVPAPTPGPSTSANRRSKRQPREATAEQWKAMTEQQGHGEAELNSK